MPLTRFMQFHEDPAIIAWWHSQLGSALSWLTPLRRRAILAVGAVWIGVSKPREILASAKNLPVPHDWVGSAIVVSILFGILWLSYRAAVRFASLPAFVRRRPQLTIHLIFWALVAVIWSTSPAAGQWRAVVAGIAITFPFLIWRCGYLLLSGQRGRSAGTRFTDHLLTLWPIYGGSNTPYGKGLDYLSRHEAKTDIDLARAQLAGIKLLLLAAAWSLAREVMDGVVYGVPGNMVTRVLYGHTFGIPRLGTLVGRDKEVSLWVPWISIYCELIRQVLTLAVHGHSIIAVLRLFGFNVFRNTYKPLLAESVVEFWGRYFYYFKELLMEFFFLPTYAQWFRTWPRLRLFAAVFAAAFFGNMYYHLFQKNLLLLGDALGAWQSLNSRLFYCLLLAVGLSVSMLRAQIPMGKPSSTSAGRRLLRIFGVWTFFGLIYIWEVKSDASFVSRTQFFWSLFWLA